MILRRATVYMMTRTLPVYITRGTRKDTKHLMLTQIASFTSQPIANEVFNDWKKMSKSASWWETQSFFMCCWTLSATFITYFQLKKCNFLKHHSFCFLFQDQSEILPSKQHVNTSKLFNNISLDSLIEVNNSNSKHIEYSAVIMYFICDEQFTVLNLLAKSRRILAKSLETFVGLLAMDSFMICNFNSTLLAVFYITLT